MTTIQLKPNKQDSLLRFHPWVFSGAIQKIVLDKDYPYAEPQEGEVVKVVDFKVDAEMALATPENCSIKSQTTLSKS